MRMSARRSTGFAEPFGFGERLRAERDGVVRHAQLVVADGAIMLGRQGGDYHAPRHGEVHQCVLVHVQDVDRHFDHAKRFGARIVEPPNNKPFGERQYTAEDLEGAPLDVLPTCSGCASTAMGCEAGGEVTHATQEERTRKSGCLNQLVADGRLSSDTC